MGNFCILVVFERRLSNAWTDHTIFHVCRDNVPLPPLGSIGPWEASEGEVKNSKNGGGLIRGADSYHFYFFLSVAKCCSICRTQTCAHSGVEPSRSAKVFLQGWPKSSKKFRIFHNFETLRPYISETIKNRGI